MSKSKNEIAAPAATGLALPDFMKSDVNAGTENLGTYIRPPRIKVVQRNSGPTLLERFTPGDTIILPQGVLIAGIKKNSAGRPESSGEPFYFTPILFFPEFVAWNPLETRGSEPAVLERSFDPKSQVAERARSEKLRQVPHATLPGKFISYVEHLNFVVVLYGEHEAAGTPMILSFARAEHKHGSNLCSLIKMRRAPIYGCQFQAIVGQRNNNKGNWLGIDVINPAGDSGVTPFVNDPARYAALKELHDEYKKAHDAAALQVDYEETDGDAVDAVSPGKQEF